MIGDGMGLESVWAAGAYQFGGKEKLNEESLQAPPKSKPVPEPEKKDLSFWREDLKKAA